MCKKLSTAWYQHRSIDGAVSVMKKVSYIRSTGKWKNNDDRIKAFIRCDTAMFIKRTHYQN